MDFNHGMVSGGFPMGAAAGLYILFGLVVMTVILVLHRNHKEEPH